MLIFIADKPLCVLASGLALYRPRVVLLFRIHKVVAGVKSRRVHFFLMRRLPASVSKYQAPFLFTNGIGNG
jgi:hypothetical protein